MKIFDQFLSRAFICLSICHPVLADIVAGEYFINTDPGQGLATAIAVASGDEVLPVVAIPPETIAALPAGIHSLSCRFQDDEGNWGIASYRVFRKVDPNNDPVPSSIVAGEYFIDTDPGQGSGIAFDFPDAVSVSREVAIPAETLAAFPDGIHSLACRFQDDLGSWGHADYRVFYKAPIIEPENALIARIDYQWYQNGAAIGEVKQIVVEPNAEVNLIESAPVTGLTVGEIYQLVVTPYDTSGRQGFSSTASFLVDEARGFQTWIETEGYTGPDARPDANPDGDCLSNLLTYALGLPSGTNGIDSEKRDRKLIPLANEPIGYVGGQLILPNPIADDIEFILEESSTLKEGEWLELARRSKDTGWVGPFAEQVIEESLTAEITKVSFRSSAPVAEKPKNFLRVKIKLRSSE